MSAELSPGGGANGRNGLGVQAYRWLVGGGMALLVLLSQRTLATLDDTTAAVRSLQAQVACDARVPPRAGSMPIPSDSIRPTGATMPRT